MAKVTVGKSLIEQIFDEMFTNLEGQAEFDAQTIQMLKQLAASNELTKPAKVTQALKAVKEAP